MTLDYIHPPAETSLQTLFALGLVEGWDEIKGLDETGCLQVTKSLVVKMNSDQQEKIRRMIVS